MAEDFEGPAALAGGSRLGAYLVERAAGGLCSAVWCPVLYYRYTVGIVHLANVADRPKALDFAAVDLAWEFSRVLAWFLKRHAYFADEDAAAGHRRGSVIDASPAGLLVELPPGSPRLRPGSFIKLRIQFPGKSLALTARIARCYEEGGSRFYGLAFQEVAALDRATLATCLYGEAEVVTQGRGGQ
jgi:hypothetical protein